MDDSWKHKGWHHSLFTLLYFEGHLGKSLKIAFKPVDPVYNSPVQKGL